MLGEEDSTRLPNQQPQPAGMTLAADLASKQSVCWVWDPRPGISIYEGALPGALVYLGYHLNCGALTSFQTPTSLRAIAI